MHIPELLFWGMFGICSEVAFTAVFDLIKKKKIALMGAYFFLDVPYLFFWFILRI